MDSLHVYCEKHNYEILETYTTLGGDYGGSHQRAIVKDQATGEKYYLYYDRSRKRKSPEQQKSDWEIWTNGGTPTSTKARGWRNTTLDNRRKAQRRNTRHLEQIVQDNAQWQPIQSK